MPAIPPFSRRNFFKGLGVTAVATASDGIKAVAEQLHETNTEKIVGPEATKITLQINGKPQTLTVEPRVTLLDALRNRLSFTGAKEVCDRATCGACTVLINGVPTYSCMKLAVDAQDVAITTVESLARDGEISAVQKAFVECDGLQCGFCTPGFVLTITALLKNNPKPSEADVRKACTGNLCRCGSYPKIFQAALTAAGVKTADQSEIHPHSANV